MDRSTLLGVAALLFSTYFVESSIIPHLKLPSKRQNSQFLTPKTQQFHIDGKAFPYINFDIGESFGGVLPVNDNSDITESSDTIEQELYFWFFPSENPLATDEILVWLTGGPGVSSLNAVFGENGPILWRPGTFLPVKNPWSWNRLTNVVYIDQPIPAGFSEGNVTAGGSKETGDQFLAFWTNFVDTFGLANQKIYLTGSGYAGQYIPYIANEMMDRADTIYYNFQGSMFNNPAINEDVPLVEVPMLAFVEYWQNLLQLNDTFMADIRRQHAEAGYTAFYKEWFTFPPKGVMPSTNNSADFSSRIRGLITDAITLQAPCFSFYHITDDCPYNLWSPNAVDAFPHPLLSQFGLSNDPNLNTGDRGPYLNTTKVREIMHAPPGKDWSPGLPAQSVFTNPQNSTSGDGSKRALLTVLPDLLERTPGMSLVVAGDLDMLIPPNGTLLTLQNATWRGAQGFSTYPDGKLVLPMSGLDVSDQGYWNGFTHLEGAGRSGEQGRWVFERGVGFVDVAYAGHAAGRYNAANLFRIIEVLLGRVSVDEGFGAVTAWSVNITAPAAEYGQ